MVVQKVFCDSLFLLRARSRKLFITSIMTQRYHRIAAGTYFSYLKAFPSFSSGCPRMTNQLFSECNQGVLPSKSVTGDWLSDMLFLGHHLDQNELKKCWYLPPFWICISLKRKLTIILWSRQNITNPQFFFLRIFDFWGWNKVKNSSYIHAVASGPKIKPRKRNSLAWGRKNLKNSFVIPGQRGHKNLVTNIATLFLMLV